MHPVFVFMRSGMHGHILMLPLKLAVKYIRYMPYVETLNKTSLKGLQRPKDCLLQFNVVVFNFLYYRKSPRIGHTFLLPILPLKIQCGLSTGTSKNPLSVTTISQSQADSWAYLFIPQRRQAPIVYHCHK